MHVQRSLGPRSAALAFAAFLAACGGGASPTAPSASTQVSSGPLLLLAGNSNAYFLAPLLLPDVIDQSNIDGSIDDWLSSAIFADASRRANLAGFVWWGAGQGTSMPGPEFAEKLRRLIGIARSTHATLPVRIVELPDRPDRALLREVQRLVAGDPGVELIPTSDLPWADEAGHFTPAGLQTVRDRIYRSLGR